MSEVFKMIRVAIEKDTLYFFPMSVNLLYTIRDFGEHRNTGKSLITVMREQCD